MAPAPKYVAWWGSDFVAAVQVWPNNVVGAYMRLLMAQLQDGHLPNDPRLLWRVSFCESREEFDGMWRAYLRDKFVEDPDNPGRILNLKMDHERRRSMGLSLAGKKAAEARWAAERERKARESGASGDAIAYADAHADGHATQTQDSSTLQMSAPSSGSLGGSGS